MNFSTSNDMDSYNSAEVIKYLKDSLYLYALSGHMSLKESLPVVDILPTIDEESESVKEDDSLERAVENLEHNEEKVLSDAEKTELADLCFDRSLHFIECHALECTLENSEQVTKDISDLAEKNLSSVPTVYKSEQNLCNREFHAAQRCEMVKNDDNISIKDTKCNSFNEDCTLLVSGEESELSVERALNPLERDSVYNATLKLPQMHIHEKGYQSKPQNDCINIVEEIGATQIKSFCPQRDTELDSSEEGQIRKELIVNHDDSNIVTNTTCYVPQKIGSHSECYSERNSEKTIQCKEKVPSKTKKKKFQTLRKWMGNLCCCARKNN